MPFVTTAVPLTAEVPLTPDETEFSEVEEPSSVVDMVVVDMELSPLLTLAVSSTDLLSVWVELLLPDNEDVKLPDRLGVAALSVDS